jgi:poly-gamma-glutamate capsule biosynthesis protein CapA/YwtB (metallophosphatase superfamily)
MLGSSFPDDSSLPPGDGKDLMRPFAEILHASDIAFGNLEGPILDGGISTKCGPQLVSAPAATGRSINCFAFRMPTRFGEDLADAGFNVMSVANNHAGDFGEAGRESTRRVLDGLGIRYAGSDRERFATTILTVRGTRIGFAGFAHNEVAPNVNELAAARRIISDLKARTDLVVVSFHGGGEGVDRQHVLPLGTTEMFHGEARGDLRAFTHTVIDAGADLVLGHGPHVLRGMELYRGHLIVYSMGNFCTYGMFNLHAETSLTALFRIRMGADGQFLDGQLYPGRQEKPGGPLPDSSLGAVRVLQQLSATDFGASAPTITADGRFF